MREHHWAKKKAKRDAETRKKIDLLRSEADALDEIKGNTFAECIATIDRYYADAWERKLSRSN
jgi:hypothetical protein